MNTKVVDGVRVKLTGQEKAARAAEELANEPERQKQAEKAAKSKLKRDGVDLGGKMCSATRDDQNGLAAISVGVIMARQAGSTFPDTVFQFVNGNELLITNANFDGYFATWSAFRQGFFAP